MTASSADVRIAKSAGGQSANKTLRLKQTSIRVLAQHCQPPCLEIRTCFFCLFFFRGEGVGVMQFSSLSLTVILFFFSFLSLSIVYVKISEAVQAGSLVQRHRWRVVRGMSEKREARSGERGARSEGARSGEPNTYFSLSAAALALIQLFAEKWMSFKCQSHFRDTLTLHTCQPS